MIYIIQQRHGGDIHYWDAPVGNGTCGWPKNYKQATSYRTIEEARKAKAAIGADVMMSGSIDIVSHPVWRMIQDLKRM